MEKKQQEELDELMHYLKLGLSCPIWTEWNIDKKTDGMYKERINKCTGGVESIKCYYSQTGTRSSIFELGA